MNGEIICVGTELLLGDILNTNAQYLSRELAALGINVYTQSVVGDNPMRLRKLLSQSVLRSELIIIVGGLGPTKDDITKETVASAVGLPLVEHPESLQRIKAYFERTGRVMTENNYKQALCPSGATVFPNDIGTAPGYAITSGEQTIIMLPGPPDELKTMFERYVRHFLERLSGGVILSRNVKIFGLGESVVAEKLADLLNMANPTVATYAKPGEVTIRVTASAEDKFQADMMCESVVNKLRGIFGDKIYGIDKDSLQQVVTEQLKLKGLKIATAESCTAGLLSSKLTEIPGSSAVFDMGIVAYNNQIKINALGVSPNTIAEYGAVSPQTAAEMALGIHAVSNADIGVSITGVAGPDTSENQPVGLVYIGLTDGSMVWVERLLAGGDRDRIRNYAALAALDLARRYLQKLPETLEGGTPVGQPVSVIDLSAHSEVGPVAAVASDDEIFRSIQSSLTQLGSEEGAAQDLGSMYFYDSDDNDEEEVLPWYKKFLRSIFPWKGDPVSEIVRKSIFIVALLTLLGTGGYILSDFILDNIENSKVDEIRKIYNREDDSINADGIYKRFEPLIAQNSDIKGWITISNTNIDYPVYQTTDNEFYVDHNLNKEKSKAGAIFIDYNAVITKERVSQNIVIYGHHRRDGSMFHNLKKYSIKSNSKALDFYKQNPLIQFDTLYRPGTYKIFAVFITNALPEHDNGNVFAYRPSEFASQQDFLKWIDEVRKRSMIITPVDVIENDEIITLSTCSYEFDDARLVVMARRVREGESTAVNVSEAKLNPNPLYPQIWYEKYGKSKPSLSSSSTTTRPQGSQTSTSSEGTTSSDSTATSEAGGSSRSGGGASSGTSSPRPQTSSSPATSTPSSQPNYSSGPSEGTVPSTDSSETGTSEPGTSSDETTTSEEEPTPSENTSSDETTTSLEEPPSEEESSEA
ncbi:MAG TPA: competence/damage-inducible protein A [Clostridiales bacterium]|nr:competence/damage-inducible protein A [Clostridiales bacterium]